VNTSDLSRELSRLQEMVHRTDFRRWLCKNDVLILEDIQACEEDRGLQLDLLSSIACMIEKGAQVVVSSDVPPEDLKGVHPALVSLLTMGGVAPVESANEQERVTMIRRHMESRPEELDAIKYLVEQVPQNRRRLWEAVFRLAKLRKNSDAPMTVRMVENVLSDKADSASSGVSNRTRTPSTEPAAPNELSASNGNKAERYRKLITAASSEQEQLTALEMALEDRLDELYTCDIDPDSQRTIGQVLNLVRNGKLKEATQWILAEKEQRTESRPENEGG
jgi:Bacterial DnaA ATPAse domain